MSINKTYEAQAQAGKALREVEALLAELDCLLATDESELIEKLEQLKERKENGH